MPARPAFLSGLKGSILAVFASLTTLSFALIVGLNFPRTQLNARTDVISSSTSMRSVRSGFLRMQTTFASFPFMHRARLCFLISETIDTVSPAQLTAWWARPNLSTCLREKMNTTALSVMAVVMG
jgi:hypothetical protein